MDEVAPIPAGVAHPAGAPGKAVWVLLPFPPDWRRLPVRKDSPWYPRARLFRQRRHDQWEPVVAKVKPKMDMFRAKMTVNRR